MSPRAYNLENRRVAVAETRSRIITAAREMLQAEEGIGSFTIDAVARKAGVARMTVYYQFESKQGLLEALLDDLAARGHIRGMGGVFREPDALAALDKLVAVFGRFWGADRLALRRLRSLAALDPEVERAVRVRDEWRRKAVDAVLQRVAQEHGLPGAAEMDEASRVLSALTSFEFFDTLAGHERNPESMVPTAQRLIRAALGLPFGDASPASAKSPARPEPVEG